MQCPACGRDTPDALMVCRHCGAETRPSLWQRLWGRLRRSTPRASIDLRPRILPDEDPIGIEMPASGARALTLTVSQSVRTESTTGIDRLDPALRAKLLAAIAASGGEVRYERTVSDEGGATSVTESGTPLDPAVREAIQRLLKSHPATAGASERQIVVEADGTRQVYQTVDDLPPEVQKLLGRFAEREIGPNDQ